MLDKHDPEYQRNRADKLVYLDVTLARGQIGEATYLRSLFILGYLPDEARTELRRVKCWIQAEAASRPSFSSSLSSQS